MEERKSKKRRRESSSSRSNSERKPRKTRRRNTKKPVSGKDLETTKSRKKSKRSSSESSNDSCSDSSDHKKKKTNGKHDRDRGKVKKRKKEKKKKKREKKDKKLKKKETAIEKLNDKQAIFVGDSQRSAVRHVQDHDQDAQQSTAGPLSQPLPKRKPMVPMTKEEFEKQQSQIRRVYDPETGRTRLVKGTGEILEEIVSKDRHKAINKAATQGDGASFQANLGLKDR